MKRTTYVLATVTVALSAVCCARPPTPQSVNDAATSAANSGQRIIIEIAAGAGIACSVDGDVGPPSYLVRDLGKPGVPRIPAHDVAIVRRIAKYLDSKDLRFAYPGGQFIVYNAINGPCEPHAPGYPVLNLQCNMMYSPTDNFDGPRAVPQCSPTMKRPWMRS